VPYSITYAHHCKVTFLLGEGEVESGAVSGAEVGLRMWEASTRRECTCDVVMCCGDVAMVLQGCYKGVTRVLQGCYKSVTSRSQACYKDGVTFVSQSAHRKVSQAGQKIVASTLQHSRQPGRVPNEW
jgi:hypothetical protein